MNLPVGNAKLSTSTPEGSGPSKTRWLALVVVISLFFIWGFITVLNDILVPHLRSVFNLNYFQASMIQFVFFGAYFIMALPAGKVISWIGYQRGMVLGLLTAGLGTLLFYPAAEELSYNLFLAALFVLATGITILQVAANPYISVLGKPETASSRLNLAQAFNSLGTTLAPWVGGVLILSQIPVGTTKLVEASSVKIPYLELTAVLVVLAIVLALIKLPILASFEEDTAHPGTLWDALKIPHLALGSLGIFLYVGAEVSIGSYLINFMMDPHVAGYTKQVAAGYVSYYWGGAMVGRFIGSALLQKIRANRLLAVNAGVATILAVVGLVSQGPLAMWSVLAIGFFNSIMFPNIFTLGIDELGHLTSRGSSILIMAIVGGAIVPAIMGRMADLFGIHHSLFIPALCYLYVIYYGLSGYRDRRASQPGTQSVA
jgi:FHS family L-fucose permease-like MFS transporter